LHAYWKLLHLPIRKQLHNNTRHPEKQPVLLHDNTIDWKFSGRNPQFQQQQAKQTKKETPL